MAASNTPNSDVANELHGNKRSTLLDVDEKLAAAQKSKSTSLHYKPGSTDIKRSIFTALPRNPKTTSAVAGNTTTSTGTQVNETIEVEKDNKSTETYTATTTDTATITTQDLETTSIEPSSASAESSTEPSTEESTAADRPAIPRTSPTNQTSSPVPCTEKSPSEVVKRKTRSKRRTPASNKIVRGRTEYIASKISSISNTTFSTTNSSSYFLCKSNNISKAKLSRIKEETPNNNTRSLTYFNSNSTTLKAKERIAKKQQNKTSVVAFSAIAKEPKRITVAATLTNCKKLQTNTPLKTTLNSASAIVLAKSEETVPKISVVTIESGTTIANNVAEDNVPFALTETTGTQIVASTVENIPTRRRIRPYSLIPIRSRSVGSPSFAEAYAKIKTLLPTPMEEDSNNNNRNSNAESGANNNGNRSDNAINENNNGNNDSNTNTNTNTNTNNSISNTNESAAASEEDNNPSTSRTSRKRKINEENTAKTSEAATTASAAAAAGPSTSTRATEEDEKDKEDDKDAKKKKNRCAECRKKVGLTGFECRCGGLYCAVHRYSDKHDCTFNYREHGAQEIRRNNPVVVGEKIQKI